MENFRKKDLINIINVYQNYINDFQNVSDEDIDNLYLEIAKQDIDRDVLYTYIKNNLYSDKLVVNKFGKKHTFDWSFVPQKAGTMTQNLAYQKMKIEQKVDEIISYFTSVNPKKV